MNSNLYSLFEAGFPADRGETFIVMANGYERTYGDLEAISARYAHALVDAGVKPGDRVAVQVDKTPEALFLYVACLRCGAAYLPLNTAYRAAEIDYFLGDAEPTVFVCRPEDADDLSKIAERNHVRTVLTLGKRGDGTLIERAEGRSEVFETAQVSDDDLGAILYTSGTTGRPKGAMLTHRNLSSNAQVLHQAWGFQPGDVLLHILPIFHTHGLFVACNCVLLNGSPMIFLDKFDPDTVIRLLPKATVMMGVPTHYVRLLAEPKFTREITQNIRLFTSGSAPLLAETFEAFEERTGHAILERCGMTETGMNTSNPLDGERRAGTVGLPLSGVEIRICGPDNTPLPVGETGSLEVKGPNVFKGYWRNPEKTKEDFREDGFFITGDMAKIDERGYVSIVGRQKDLIISGGFNVYPKEVEMVIDELSDVDESAVIGLPHPDFGEAVAAVVTLKGGSTDEDAIVAHVKEQLANYKVPKRVFILEELPRNAMGKVQKNVLRDSYKTTFGG